MADNQYEVRLYRFKPAGDPKHDEAKWPGPEEKFPNHPYYKSLKWKGFFAELVATGIPIESLTFGWRLDEISSANITIPLDMRDDVGVPKDVLASIEPYQYCVAIFRKGARGVSWLQWGGIIWTMHMELERRLITLSARDFMSFYEGRLFDGSHHVKITDSKTGKPILDSQGREMWDDAPRDKMELIYNVLHSTWHNWDMNISLEPKAQNFPPTGNAITWWYTKDDAKNCWDVLSEQIDSRNGTFLLAYPWLEFSGTKQERLRFSAYATSDRVPTTMVKRGEEKLPMTDSMGNRALIDHVNCEVHEIFFDGTQKANVATAIGSNKTTTINRIRQNTKALAKFPKRDVVARYHDIGSTAELDARADKMLSFGDPGIRVPRITTYPNLYDDPAWFNPNLGIKIPVRVDAGFLSVNEDFVITETTVIVGKDGSDRMELTLAQEKLFRTDNHNG
ncbi:MULTISPECIES: hypothetical protein [Streptomyces]